MYISFVRRVYAYGTEQFIHQRAVKDIFIVILLSTLF